MLKTTQKQQNSIFTSSLASVVPTSLLCCNEVWFSVISKWLSTLMELHYVKWLLEG